MELRQRVTTEWEFYFDQKSYRVIRVVGGLNEWEQKQSERWRVLVWARNREIHCDKDKPTHKRVVAALKAELEARDEQA